MKKRITCEPELLEFDSVPLFGETVFRLGLRTRDKPQIALCCPDHTWQVYPLEREANDEFYIALQLSPGLYHYRFLAGRSVLLDPCNPRPLVVQHGLPANTVQIEDISKTLRFSIESAKTVEATVQPENFALVIRPERVRITPNVDALVQVSLVMTDPMPGTLHTGIRLLDLNSGQLLSRHQIIVNFGPATVPFLSWEDGVIDDGTNYYVDIKTRGRGRLQCVIVDRVTCKTTLVDMVHRQDYSEAVYRYPVLRASADEWRQTSNIPPLIIMSDSPFPEQRYIQVQLANHCQREVA